MQNDRMKELAVEVSVQKKVRNQRRRRVATRISLLVILFVALVAAVGFSSTWLYRFFYTDNPHFLFRELVVEDTVHFNQKSVQELLEGDEDYPCSIGRTSLIGLDLGRLRAEFLKNPLVKNVAIRRVMPSTLEIEIHERNAIALLCAGKTVCSLADENGILFPYMGKEGLNLPLPFIIGYKGVESLPMGSPVDDAGIKGAIGLINEIGSRSKIDGAAYAPNVIKINQSRERLEVTLRPLSGNKVFPSAGATVWLPWDGDKMLEALGRLDAILVRKIRDDETLSFADVTLQYNVPTRD